MYHLKCKKKQLTLKKSNKKKNNNKIDKTRPIVLSI